MPLFNRFLLLGFLGIGFFVLAFLFAFFSIVLDNLAREEVLLQRVVDECFGCVFLLTLVLALLTLREGPGPVLKFNLCDVVIKVLSEFGVGQDSLVVELVLWNEINLVKLVTSLVDSLNQRLNPDRHA